MQSMTPYLKVLLVEGMNRLPIQCITIVVISTLVAATPGVGANNAAAMVIRVAPIRGVSFPLGAAGATGVIPSGGMSPWDDSGMQLGVSPMDFSLPVMPSLLAEQAAAPAAVSVLLNAPAIEASLAQAAAQASASKLSVLGRLERHAGSVRRSMESGNPGQAGAYLSVLFRESTLHFGGAPAVNGAARRSGGANSSLKATERIRFGSAVSLNTLHVSIQRQANILRRTSAHANVLKKLRKIEKQFKTESLMALGFGTDINSMYMTTSINLGGKTDGDTVQSYGELWIKEYRGNPNIEVNFFPSSKQNPDSRQLLIDPPILVNRLSEQIDHYSSALDEFFENDVFLAKVNFLRSAVASGKAIMAFGLDVKIDGGYIHLLINLGLFRLGQTEIEPFGRLTARKSQHSNKMVVDFVPSK